MNEVNSIRPRLLFLSAHLPYSGATQAGQITAARNLIELAKKYDIHLISFRNKLESLWPLDSIKKYCAHLEIFDIDTKERIFGGIRAIHLPLLVAARNHRGFRLAVRRAVASINFTRLHLEWTQMLLYLPECLMIQNTSLFVHDVLSQSLYRQIEQLTPIASFPIHFELARTKFWESRQLLKVGKIFVPSKKDAELVCLLVKSVAVSPTILPLAFNLLPPRVLFPSGKLRIAYWGSYARKENVDAALFLMDYVLPSLHSLGLDVEVLLLGADPPSALEVRRSKNVIITGFVPDPTELLWSAHIAVLPIRLGAGVKIKVLECLGAGLPVVTTSVGAEGIPCGPDQGLFIVPEFSASNIAAKVAELLKNRTYIEQLSLTASKWVREYANVNYEKILNE